MADETAGNQPGDGEATPKVEPTISVQETTTAPLVSDTTEPTTAETEDTGSEAAQAEQQDGRKPIQKLPDWAQKKMNELAAGEREAKRRAKELEAALEAAKAPPKPATPNADDAAAVQANAPAGGYKTQADFDAAVQAEANKREASAREQAFQADFNTRSNATFEKGVADYGDDFKTAVGTLQQMGVMAPEFVGLVLETDNPAQVLMELGADPARAMELINMTPAKRAIEVARLAIVPPKKAAEPLSKAPAPVRPVDGTARVNGDPKDDDDDATWFNKRIAQRQQRLSA